jgi:modulator of FtsH protease HflK
MLKLKGWRIFNANEGPPDLDKIWQDFNKRLGKLFGVKGKRDNSAWGNSGGDGAGGNGGNGGGFRPTGRGAGIGLGVILGAIVALWLASGFYILPEGQNAAILRFGEFKNIVSSAGFKWRWPKPIEDHEMVNVQQLRQVEVGYRGNVKTKQTKESLMLTGDQSIVDMQFAVQYRISNPADWLFSNKPNRDAEELLRQAAETAMRAVVGRKQIDDVLYAEKDSVGKDALKEMQSIVDRYKAGVTINDLTIQQVQPPEPVQAAFEDANKAAQDREALINEGSAYANDVIPKAKGTAARLLQEAEGYKSRIVSTAEGDASRFNQVYTEYSKAPQVTRERIYLETMQQIYSNANKVFVDNKSGSGNGSLLYLPLDKLMQQAGGNLGTIEVPRPVVPEPRAEVPRAADDRRTDIRNRER